jgi:hypothetical protein
VSQLHPARPIRSDEAIRATESDARRAYRDLDPFRVTCKLEADGWHVDYGLKDPEMNGGGPHYVIDTVTGAILRKRYEQ